MTLQLQYKICSSSSLFSDIWVSNFYKENISDFQNKISKLSNFQSALLKDWKYCIWSDCVCCLHHISAYTAAWRNAVGICLCRSLICTFLLLAQLFQNFTISTLIMSCYVWDMAFLFLFSQSVAFISCISLKLQLWYELSLIGILCRKLKCMAHKLVLFAILGLIFTKCTPFRVPIN